jgi:FMN phosphatase YigB (HAD superfamily)
MTRIAVGFDFDHTLGLDNGLEVHAFVRLAEHLGATLDAEDPATHHAVGDLMHAFRCGEETMSAMVARFAATSAPNGRRGDVAPDALAARFREICYDLVGELVVPMPGALACIQGLVARGIPVGILTNGWSELQERKIAHALGEFPGPVFVSDTIRAYKPSADAFRTLEAALSVDPTQLWYVGDNPAADVAGARAYGLRAVWFNCEGHAYPVDLPPPTAVIEHLDALAGIVRGA